MVTDNKVSTTHNVFTPDLTKHGSRYKDLASANPYANVQYRQSWIQKFLERIGFRTNKDAYLESMALQAQEYDNALLQKEYDESYNSPLAQAERERAAGLNPNLTGNVSAGESSPIQDDGNPPIAPEADDLSMVQNFATSILSGVQFAFGIAKDFQALHSMKLDNLGKEDDFTMNALLNVVPEVYDDQKGVDWALVPSYYNSFKKAYGNVMSKKQFERFVKRASAFQNGLAFREKQFGYLDSRASKRKSYFRNVSGEDYSESDPVMRVISKELSDLAVKLFKNRTSADATKALNDEDYENMVRPAQNYNNQQFELSRNGRVEGLQHNRGLVLDNDLKDEEVNMKRYRNELRSSFDEIMGQLNNLSDNGNSFASIVKAVISAIIIKQLGD